MRGNIAAGILAGGQSKRMGKNKAGLGFQSKSFLEHILDQCSGFKEKMVSVDYLGKYTWVTPKDITFVEDELVEFGPIEGIYQLLSHMKGEACFVVATDMPGLTRDFMEDVARTYKGEDILTLTVEGRPQPLCAIYHRRCIPALEQCRREGIHKPRQLFEQMKTKYLPIEEMGYTRELVENVNTPEEYKSIVQKKQEDIS